MFVLLLTGCLGPDAPDAAVCRDYIHRVCIAPVCAQAAALFTPPAGCETTLQTKSGCISDDFVFTTSPSRERFLNCRLPLLRADGNSEAHPSCDDVAESFSHCPDVARLLQGIK